MEQSQTSQQNAEEVVLTLPETVTINGVPQRVDSIPELANYQNTLRGQIAKQERDKLYTQINALKAKVNELANVQIVPAQPVDVATLITQAQDGLLEKLTEVINQKLAPVEKTSELLQKQNLAQYRNELLTLHQGKVMPELVVGNSKEELDAALEHSLNLFAKYGKQVFAEITTPETQANTPASPANATLSTLEQPKTETVAPTPAPTPTPAVVVPAVAPNPALSVNNLIPGIPDVKTMTDEEYAANRKKLLSDLKTLIPEQA